MVFTDNHEKLIIMLMKWKMFHKCVCSECCYSIWMTLPSILIVIQGALALLSIIFTLLEYQSRVTLQFIPYSTVVDRLLVWSFNIVMNIWLFPYRPSGRHHRSSWDDCKWEACNTPCALLLDADVSWRQQTFKLFNLAVLHASHLQSSHEDLWCRPGGR